MEIFDIVNEKDEVIGTASREECHSNPSLMHRTVQFTLIDKKNNKILITKRAFSKENDPGKICFLGEHMLAGESYERAIKRGSVEELGFSPNKFYELNHQIFHYDEQTEFVRFFLIEWEGETLKFDPKEVEEIFWITTKQLKENSYDFGGMTKFWIDNTDLKLH